MNAKDKLNELNKRISDFLKLSSENVVVNGVESLIKLEPHIELITEAFSGMVKTVNDCKLFYAWKCISQGLNTERAINEMYNYVDNPGRAYHLSNMMREIVLSNSVLASSILGYILGEMIFEKREFTQEDAILCDALSRMTDFDVKNFAEIMDSYIGSEFGEEYVDLAKIDKEKKNGIIMSLDLFVNTRLFQKVNSVYKDKTLHMDGSYKKNYIADKMKNYIDKMKQILDYK